LWLVALSSNVGIGRNPTYGYFSLHRGKKPPDSANDCYWLLAAIHGTAPNY